jgi:hypothetical protein
MTSTFFLEQAGDSRSYEQNMHGDLHESDNALKNAQNLAKIWEENCKANQKQKLIRTVIMTFKSNSGIPYRTISHFDLCTDQIFWSFFFDFVGNMIQFQTPIFTKLVMSYKDQPHLDRHEGVYLLIAIFLSKLTESFSNTQSAYRMVRISN